MKNKYKKLKISLIAFLLLINSVNSQSLQELMSNQVQYSEIVKIMDKKFKNKSFIKEQPNYSREFKQFKRWEYFWKYRLLPNGNFPNTNLIFKAWKTIKSEAKTVARRISNWEYFGPLNLPKSDVTYYPGLGRINAIAIHPTNHNILFAGGASSGVWKSIDKGATWSPKTDDMPNVGISSIVFDPNNPNTIYAATGDADGFREPYSTGIFKSTDLGETWYIVGLNHKPSDKFNIRRMVMPTTPSNTLIVTTSTGIRKSTDGGVTFTSVSTAKGYGIYKVPNSDSIFYSGTSDGKIFKSTNGGNTWTDISPSSPTLSGRVELGITVDDTNFIMAVDFKGNMVKSMDGGITWTTVKKPSQYETQGGYNMTLAISPNDKNRIILGGIDGWRTTDGGLTWEKYLDGYWEVGTPYFYVHSDHHMMCFVPGGSDTLFVANDGGVAYGDITKDISFTDITEGLFTTQYHGIGTLRTNPGVIIGGAQDNDAIYINGNNSKGILPASDGSDGMIDYSNPNISYASTVRGYLIRKTINNWTSSTELSIPNYRAPFKVPMAMHPTIPTTIFFAGNKLFKSENAGDTWNFLYTVDTSGGFKYNSIINFTISSSDGNIMVFSTSKSRNVLKRSVDGGQTWTDLNDIEEVSGSSFTMISGIAINATNPDIMYVSMSGFDEGNKVFKTMDAGQTWQNISYNLPNIPTNDIAYAIGTNDDLYLATDLGVYVNSSGESTWTLFNTNLPYTQVNELEFHYESNTVFAGTFGRGIWKSNLKNNVNSTEKIKKETGIKIFPSLNNGIFNIEIEEFGLNKPYKILIFNTIGGIVYNKEHIGLQQHIDISNVVSGVYFVSIHKDNKFFTQKIIIDAK